MKTIVTGKEMKQMDENTNKILGVPSMVLMERAGEAVADEVSSRFDLSKKIGCICGKGNNGGDAIAAGRILFERGYDVLLFFPREIHVASDQSRQQFEIATHYQIHCTTDMNELSDCDILLDGLFGIGLNRALSEEDILLIQSMNQLQKYVIAIDIPSGIFVDNGASMGEVVSAELTVSFAFLKVGHLLYPGKSYSKDVIVRDIGITNHSLGDKTIHSMQLQKEDVAALMPARQDHSHKGNYGKVLVIAGSKGMAGAAYFSAKSAYLMGAGLVQIVSCEENRYILQTLLPEAIFFGYESHLDENEILEKIKWADVILIGPGLSVQPLSKQLLELCLSASEVPLICDADAINMLADDILLLKRAHTEIILTPHMGEMSKLLKMSIARILENEKEICEEFSRNYQVDCVLKDATTLITIPYKTTYFNTNGHNGMASAGSGDILAGMIAGLIAIGMSCDDAAAVGPFLHGASGSYAVNVTGANSCMASDIMSQIPSVLCDIMKDSTSC